MVNRLRAVRRRFTRDERGATIVEFALIAPLFLLIVFAAIDVGRAYYTVNQLATAVREGARYAAMQENPVAEIAEVRDRVRGAAPSLGGAPIADDRIEVVIGGAPSQATVTVRVRDYPLRFVTPFGAVVGKSLVLTREATFLWEQAPAL